MLRSLPSLLRAGSGSAAAAARHQYLHRHAASPFVTRAFSSSSPEPGKDDTDTKEQVQGRRHWSGVSRKYLSWRGLTIAARVLWHIPDFFRYNDKDIFLRGTSDDVRSSMFVLTQFPAATNVDLEEFVHGAEKVAHTVFERLYASPASVQQYLESVVAPEAMSYFLRKPSALMEETRKTKRRVVLEQLNINSATLRSVQYTSKLLGQHIDPVEQEWLACEVQYDVTEHLLLAPEDERAGIEDRRAVNTRFTWKFEADVTRPDEIEWAIVEATPFEEKAAVLAPRGEVSG